MLKKKLVIFMPSIEGGGVEKNLFIVSNYLGKKLSDTKIITADTSNNKKFQNLKIINPNIKLLKIKSRLWKFIICIFELIKIILKNKNIIVLSFQANLYCAIICKLIFNVTLVSRANSSPSGWSSNIFKNFIFKYLLGKIDFIIVNSLLFKKEIDKKFGLKSKCIYNPLNIKQIKLLSKKKVFLKIPKKKLILINIGRLVHQKNQITFLKSLNLLKDKLDFFAIILGQGNLRKQLNQFIIKNKLNKKVQIIKYKNNPYPLIKKSDILVHSALYEGLPNVLLEALALKKFVISSDCPTGPREILSNGNGGDLFEPKNYKLLAKKILSYSKNKKMNNKKIKFGYKNLNKFDYQINLEKYLNLIKTLQ